MSFTDSGFILERLLSVINAPARFVVRRTGACDYFYLTVIVMYFLVSL